MSLIKVVKSLGQQKQFGVVYSQQVSDKTVARILNSKTGKVEGFVNMSEGTDKQEVQVDLRLYDIEPMVPINKQSIRIVITGESDTGKSTLSALFLNQYEQMYPDNQMFLISQKKKEIDRNLSQIENLYQLTDEEINEFDIGDFSDCIFLVDDSDFGKNANKVFELLNQVASVGRESGVGYIFVSHFNSRLNKTTAYKEWQYYITFRDNLANNRMLETHMGFTKKEIEKFQQIKGSFFCFNKIYNCLITDEGVQKIKTASKVIKKEKEENPKPIPKPTAREKVIRDYAKEKEIKNMRKAVKKYYK